MPHKAPVMKNISFQNKDYILRLNGFLAARFGLEFSNACFNDIERKMIDVACEAGFSDIEAFVEFLLSSSSSGKYLNKIVCLLTNGETYFWREPLVFEALMKRILPELIRVRESSDRYLRIWSAGCSSGEEPYSIAIALRSVIPDLERWNVKILATDINTDSLRKASIGIYGEWSFRNAPAAFIEQNFQLQKDGKQKILPEIKKMVSFAQLNFAEDVFPSPSNNTNMMDIIFCRNVLMYFSAKRATDVRNRLYDCLTDGGWLLVGASELSQSLFARFQSVQVDDVFTYRKPKDSARLPEIASSNYKKESIWPYLSFLIPNPTPKVTVMEPPAEKVQGETPLIDAIAYARTLADRGDLNAALALCEEALSREKLDPVLYYLRALIFQEMGRIEESSCSLKRALFIEPQFILAHFALGNIAMRKGDMETGHRCLKNALSLIEPLADSDVFPESAGLTIGRFREIIRSVIQGGVKT